MLRPEQSGRVGSNGAVTEGEGVSFEKERLRVLPVYGILLSPVDDRLCVHGVAED